MLAITAASGQLGQLVIEHLLKQGVSPGEITAIARSTEKLDHFKEKGVKVVFGDYQDKASLQKALEGIDRLLLISSGDLQGRAEQHQNAIDAAKASGVDRVYYTSILHAQSSPLGLATDHVATENALQSSDLDYVLLRNGWYSENYTMGVPQAVESQTIYGCAGTGRISSAARSDYALAAAILITQQENEKQIYELAGDESYTLSELAEAVSALSQVKVSYQDMPEDKYKGALMDMGLPEAVAEMLANSEAGAARGGLFDDQKELSKVIGRPTVSLRDSLKKVLL